VALLVIDGRSDREISQRLYLSRHTVSQYVKRIYRKLDVTSRVALSPSWAMIGRVASPVRA
jgi:DNA-binding CsgD family transcriptional regulator